MPDAQPYDVASGGPPPPPSTKAELTVPMGYSGTALYAGLLSQEYLPALQSQRAYAIYDQMRRSDGQVAATLAVWELPIRAAAWYCEPADPDDTTSVEQADFVSYCLFEYGAQAFDNLLYEILTMFPFGFSVFEKVYSYLGPGDWGGKLALRKLAGRDQKSIWSWRVKDGDLTGVDQLGAPYWRKVTLPADKLAVFTHRREGDNFEGISLLRPAYKHWFMKDHLYKLQAVVLERNGLGVVVAQWDDNLSAAQVAELKAVVENIRVNESIGITVPTKGVTLTMLEHKGLGTAVQAFQTAIDHHDLKIAGSCLAGFLNLAGGGGGSYALSADHSELLMYAIGAAADYVAAVFNQQVIPQLISLNYGEQARYPELRHSRIGGAHLADLGATMRGFADAGLLTPTFERDNALGEELGLPEITAEDWQKAHQQVVPALTPDDQPAAATDNGGDQPGQGGDGESADQPIQQGKLRALREDYDHTVGGATARLTNATRRLALSEKSQQYGERPSTYRQRTRKRVWAGV